LLPAEEGRLILLNFIFLSDRRPSQKIRRRPPGSPPSARRSGSWLTHPVLIHAVVLGALGAILAYGVVGLSIAGESETWQQHAWVPRLLVIASAFLIATTFYRIARRWYR
jgi:sulfite exporter TauE/SafE